MMRIKLNSIEDANKLASICDKFVEDIDIVVGRYIIDGKSYLGILSIGIPNEMDIHIHGTREQELKLKEMIKQWILEE